MDPKTLELLEFRKIQEVLAREADTDFGRKRAMEALPTSTSLARESRNWGERWMCSPSMPPGFPAPPT